jgi:hypothetical protein
MPGHQVQALDQRADTQSVEVLTSTTLDRARQIVQHAPAVSPSASLLRLEQQLRQGDSNARQLAKLIDGSPALAARVLRMANSAFYAPAEPVTTLSRAVALLGTSKPSDLGRRDAPAPVPRSGCVRQGGNPARNQPAGLIRFSYQRAISQ